jgi:hypothetical protein
MSRGAARDALGALLAGGDQSGLPASASHWRAEAARLTGVADPPVVAQAEELARRAPSPPPPESRGEGSAATPPDEPLTPSHGEAPVADVAVDALIGTVEMLVAEGHSSLAEKALQRLQAAAALRRAVSGRVAPLGAVSRAPMLRCSRALAALVGAEDADVAVAAAHAFFALCQVSTSPTPRALLAAALVALPPERQELACAGCLEHVDADELASLRGDMLNLLKRGDDSQAPVDWETGDIGLNKTLHVFLPIVLVTNPACRVDPCETLFASLATVIEAMLAAGQPPPENSAALAISLILLRSNAGAVGELSFSSARPALVNVLRSSGVAPRLRAALASIVASCADCNTAMAAIAARTLADFAGVFDVPAAERAEQLRAAMPAPLLVTALALWRPTTFDANAKLKQKLRDAEAALCDAGRATALAAALTPSAHASLALLTPALELLEDAAALLAPPPTQPETGAGGQAPCTVPLHRGPDAPLLSAVDAHATWALLVASADLSMATPPLPALLPPSESEVAQHWGWSGTIASSYVIFDPPGADGARLGMRKAAGTRGYSAAFGSARLWRGTHRWEVRLVNAGDRACVGVAAGPEPVAAARAGAWLCGSRNAWVLVSGGPGQPARGAYADGRREAGVVARLGAGALVAVSYDADAGTLRFAVDGADVAGLTLRNVPRGARPVVCLDGAGEGAQLVGRWRVMPAEMRQPSPDAPPAPLNAAVTLVRRAMLMLLGWLRAAETGRAEAAARPDADSSSGEAGEEDPAVRRGADAALVAPPVLLRVLQALTAVMEGLKHDAAPSKSGVLFALVQLLPPACALARAVASTPTADVAGLPPLLERVALASRALELRASTAGVPPGSAASVRSTSLATVMSNGRAALSAAAGVLVGRAQREWPLAADAPLGSALFAGGMCVTIPPVVNEAFETAVGAAPPASSGAAALSPALASAECAAYAVILHASADGSAALAESRRVADELLRRARAEAQPDASPAPAAYATSAAAVRHRARFLLSFKPSVAALGGAAAAAAAARAFLLDGPEMVACVAAFRDAAAAAERYGSAHSAAASLLNQLGWADQRTSAPLLTSMLAERACASLEAPRAPGAGGAGVGSIELAATAEAMLRGALLQHAGMMVPSASMAAAALVVPFSAQAVAGDVVDAVAAKLARCAADALSRSPALLFLNAPPGDDGPAETVEPGLTWPLAALRAALLRAAVAVEAAPAGDDEAAATASAALAAALEAACLPLAALLGHCISAATVAKPSTQVLAGRARRSRQLTLLLRSVSTAVVAAPDAARTALAKTHGVLVRIAASAAPTPSARAAAADALARTLAAGGSELDFASFDGLLAAAVAASPDTALFEVLTLKAGAPLRQPQPAPSLPLRRALLGALRASPAATSRALQRDDGLHSRGITLLIGLPPGIAGIAPIAKDITTEAATRVLALLAVVGGASDAELPCALPQEGPLRALIAGAGPQLLPLLADAVPPDEWDDMLRLGDRLMRVTLAARCAKTLWEALRRDDDDAVRLAASLRAEPDEEEEEEDPPPAWRALLLLAARAPEAKLAGVCVEQLAATAALYSHRLVSDTDAAALASAPPSTLNALAPSLHRPAKQKEAAADVAVPEKLGRLLWRAPEAQPLLPRRGAPVPPPEVLRRHALDAAAKTHALSVEPHAALAAAEMAAAVLYARMALLRALALAPPAQHEPLDAEDACDVAAVLRFCLLPVQREQRWARRADGLPAVRAFTRGGGADADEDAGDTSAAVALLAALRGCAGPTLAEAVAAQLRMLPAALAPSARDASAPVAFDPGARPGAWLTEGTALETPPLAVATVALAAALLPLLPAGELPARQLSVALGTAVLEPLLPPQARAAAIEALLAERGALPAGAPLTGGLTALLPARRDVAIVAAAQLLLEPAAPCLANRTILRFSAAALQRAGIALPALEHLERRRRMPAFASPLAAAMTELHLAVSSAGGGGVEHIEPRLPDRPLLAFERLHELGCTLDAGAAMPEWAERELTRLLATQPAPVASGAHGEFRRAASGADVRLSADRRRMWVVVGDEAGEDEAPLAGTHDAEENVRLGPPPPAGPPDDDADEAPFGYTTDDRVSALLGPPGGMARGSGVHSVEFIMLAGEEMSVGLAAGVASGHPPANDGQSLRASRMPGGGTAEWFYALHAWGDENGHSYDDADSDDGWEGPASLLDCDDAAFQAAADEAAALSGWDIDPFDPCGGASGGAETTRCLEFFSPGDTVRLSLDTGDAEDAASPRMPSLTVYINGLRAGPRVAGLASAFPLYFAVGGTGGTELAVVSATTRPPYSKAAYKDKQLLAAQWAKEPPRPVAVRQPGPVWSYPANDAELVAWVAATAAAQRGCTGTSALTPGDVFALAHKAVCGAAGSVPLPPSLDPFFGPDRRALMARFTTLWLYNALAAPLLPLLGLGAAPAARSLAADVARRATLLFPEVKAARALRPALAASAPRHGAPLPQARADRGAAQVAGAADAGRTLWGQLAPQLGPAAPFLQPPAPPGRGGGGDTRLWSVAFAGEGGTDAGGLFRESLRALAAELAAFAPACAATSAPLLRAADGAPAGSALATLNPGAASKGALEMLRLLGHVMAGCLRVRCPLELALAPPVWAALLADGADVAGAAAATGAPVQALALRDGLRAGVPRAALALLAPQELEAAVCGAPALTLPQLRAATVLAGNLSAEAAEQFWQALATFTPAELSALLAFATGCGRLRPSATLAAGASPHGAAALIVQPAEQHFGAPAPDAPSSRLPTSHTCAGALDLPPYASVEDCAERLRYAITHCRAIDADFIVRDAPLFEPPLNGGGGSAAASSPAGEAAPWAWGRVIVSRVPVARGSSADDADSEADAAEAAALSAYDAALASRGAFSHDGGSVGLESGSDDDGTEEEGDNDTELDVCDCPTCMAARLAAEDDSGGDEVTDDDEEASDEDDDDYEESDDYDDDDEEYSDEDYDGGCNCACPRMGVCSVLARADLCALSMQAPTAARTGAPSSAGRSACAPASSTAPAEEVAPPPLLPLPSRRTTGRSGARRACASRPPTRRPRLRPPRTTTTRKALRRGAATGRPPPKRAPRAQHCDGQRTREDAPTVCVSKRSVACQRKRPRRLLSLCRRCSRLRALLSRGRLSRRRLGCCRGCSRSSRPGLLWRGDLHSKETEPRKVLGRHLRVRRERAQAAPARAVVDVRQQHGRLRLRHVEGDARPSLRVESACREHSRKV